MRYVIFIVSILAIMYFIMFLSAQKRKRTADNERANVQKSRLKYQNHIKSQQTAAAHKQNYVAKYNATVDYLEKEKPSKQLPTE